MRLGWGPPENDASSPHELDREQLKRSRGQSPERPERRRCATASRLKADSSPFNREGLDGFSKGDNNGC